MTIAALQVQGCVGSPQEPQGQGFMAASNMKLAGKVSEPLARLIVTT